MTNWNTLVEYVNRNYRVSEQNDDMIRMVFELGDMRSQLVFIWKQTLYGGDEEWVQIDSPFGKLNDVDLPAVIRHAGDMVCGGVAAVGDTLTYRHSVPLLNMDINEFERPLMLVTNTADKLERQFTGGDVY